MQAFLEWLLGVFGGLSNLVTFNGMYVVGIILSIPMTIIFVGEIFNYQFRFGAPWFVRVQRRWNTKAVACGDDRRAVGDFADGGRGDRADAWHHHLSH